MKGKMRNIGDKDLPIFQKFGIEFENDKFGRRISFERRNLILGENGSGKTRFLKSMEQLLADEQEATVVTMYLTEAASRATDTKCDNNDSEPSSLFDILKGNEHIEFEDFIKKIEKAHDRLTFADNFSKWMELPAHRERKKAVESFAALNQMLKDLANREISFRNDDNNSVQVEKYNSETGEAIRTASMEEAFSTKEMSPGELMLYYFSLFYYYIQMARPNKKIILLIDEPELHLHPQKLLLFIQKLLDSEIIEELWVASHSLFLIPLFKFGGLVFINNNTVCNRSRNTYKNIYDKIVGLDNCDVFEFLKSIESWQYYQFIKECFCLPTVVDKIDTKDEEFVKTVQKLREIQSQRPLQVLDFGAGECRIWDCLKLDFADRGELDALLRYEAYEPYPKADTIYDPSIKVYKSEGKLAAVYGRYDVVILMNVLHEVPVNEWCETLELVGNLLCDGGSLVFLEVVTLTNGEQPYGNTGYLVLGERQVMNYLGAINAGRDSNSEKSNCWIIPKDNLNINVSIVKDCIESLRDDTLELLEEAYKERIALAHNSQCGGSANIGLPARKYAFWSQQYINTLFALKELEALQALRRNSNYTKDMPIASVPAPQIP